MAWLRKGAKTRVSAAGDPFLARLRGFPLLSGLAEDELKDIAASFEWRHLAAGEILFHQGDPGDAMYIVDTGCLAVIRKGTDGAEDVVVGELHAGQTVGEMGPLLGEPRSAAVVAWRDSRLLRISTALYRELLGRHPNLGLYLAAELARRLSNLTRSEPSRRTPKTLALVPLLAESPVLPLAGALSDEYRRGGRRTEVIAKEAGQHPSEWFDAAEAGNDLLIFVAEASLSPWTEFCMRQADRILLVTQKGRWLPASSEIPAQIVENGRCFDLVVLHPGKHGGGAGGEGRCPGKVPGMDLCCHLRPNEPGDLGRLARLAAEDAIGLVLAGGGARGFAHIGAIRAFRASGIPIDIVGGTSMGAIVAAGLACDWGDDELRQRMRRALVDRNPVNDYTVPWLALLKGGKIEGRLRRHFGNIGIEELWRPYFCLSASLTTGRAVVHRSGLLWRALRASISIPGLLPPVLEAGELLADGGIVNNFPVDVLRAMRRGPVIGVNVVTDLVPGLAGFPSGGSGEGRHNGSNWTPPIIHVLVRAGTMTGNAQVELCRRQADLLIEPPLMDIGLLDWNAFDRAIEIGYRSTMESLERYGSVMAARFPGLGNSMLSSADIQGLP